jgi:hypothetical protein
VAITRCLGLSLAFLAALTISVGPAQAAAPDDFFGMDGDALMGHPDAAANMATIASGGVQLVRAFAHTQLAGDNGPPGSYYWFNEDLLEQNAAAAGLRWYPFIGWAPLGDQPGDQNVPPNTGDYTAYATALAQRYGRGGSFWADHPELPYLPVTAYEVWNEENALAFWHPQDDAPERYADLYLATRDAIKAVDPDATVVVGGLALGQPGQATDEVEFLTRMFAARPDLRGRVDAIGLHPYQPTLQDVYARLARFRQAVDGLAGPQVPIEITEVGWSTTSTPESERASDLSTLATDLPRSDCNVGRLIPYSWINGPFAIANSNGTTKPAGQAYLDAVKAMRGLSSAAAPGGTVKICHSDPVPPAAPAPPAVPAHGRVVVLGPRLSLRVIRERPRFSRVRVIARCPSGCRLRAELLAARGRSGRVLRLAVRSFALSSRRRRFTFHLPRRARRMHLRALATGADGGRTTRTLAI